jgi:diadenosine tetraphosphatase ApaH/serine/threonine PP2A family protein phosphatase
MQKRRLIVVGDVHGCLDELKLLVNKLAYNKKKDRLIFTGDLVDRGPASASCLSYIRKLGAETVRGNHDDKYIRYHKHSQKVKESIERNDKKKYKNPMTFSQEQLDIYKEITEEDLKWLDKTQSSIYIPTLNMLIAHAGVNPQWYPINQKERIYRFVRYVDNTTKKMVKLDEDLQKPKNSSFWAEFYNWSVDIVYGHHVVNLKNPRIDHNQSGGRAIGIDTGCCFNGYLTAFVVNTDGTEEFVQVPAACEYENYVFHNRN